MQTDNRLFDDLARVATNAFGSLQSARDEATNRIRQQFERVIESMDLVSREELEVVKAMAQKSRLENDKLSKRVAELEAKLGIAKKPANKPSAPQSRAAKSKKRATGLKTVTRASTSKSARQSPRKATTKGSHRRSK
tara:strand:- start:236 stop:646 length:411 start_codon:yes stop_codon:yes gene_type:complete